jgi:hypothetical protein
MRRGSLREPALAYRRLVLRKDQPEKSGSLASFWRESVVEPLVTDARSAVVWEDPVLSEMRDYLTGTPAQE